MTATIRANGHEATVSNGEWISDSAEFADACAVLSGVDSLRRKGKYDPDPDFSAARRVADLLDGEVVAYVPPAPHYSDATY
jgi:hypothetical protein